MDAARSWIVVARPNPAARLRLFCFPYAGGGASIFRNWSRRLPSDIEIYAVQPPGREGRLKERPYHAMADLVEALGSTLEAHLDRPFAFFGHSNGGLMAFELIRRLRRVGGPMPLAFFPSARSAPHAPRREAAIHTLPHERFIERLRRLEGTPAEVLQNEELMSFLLPLLRADFSLAETYVYREEPALEIPITAFGGKHDQEVSQEEVEAWACHTTAAFRVRMFQSGHFFLQEIAEVFLKALAEELKILLNDVAHAS